MIQGKLHILGTDQLEDWSCSFRVRKTVKMGVTSKRQCQLSAGNIKLEMPHGSVAMWKGLWLYEFSGDKCVEGKPSVCR